MLTISSSIARTGTTFVSTGIAKAAAENGGARNLAAGRLCHASLR
jgi:hypothetical protein